MTKVRAKFECRAVTKEGDNSRVTLDAVIDGSPENERFFAATPGGDINLFVLSEETAGRFEVGKEYFVDFTAAD